MGGDSLEREVVTVASGLKCDRSRYHRNYRVVHVNASLPEPLTAASKLLLQ